RSKNLLIQMIGRGLRLHPGKQNCHIIDMVASLETGIINTPTLLGLDPDEGLDQVSMEDAKKMRESNGQGFSRPTLDQDPDADLTVTLTDYDSVQDLLQDN